MRTLGIVGAVLAGLIGGTVLGFIISLFIPGSQILFVPLLAIGIAIWLGRTVARATRKEAA